MENRMILMALPFVVFVLTWVLCYLYTKTKNHRRDSDLRAAKLDLKRYQTDMTELEGKFTMLSEEKAAQDIVCGCLETDRDRLEKDCLAIKVEMDALRQVQQETLESRAKALEAVEKLTDQLENKHISFEERIKEKEQYCAQLDQKLTKAAKQLMECREALMKAQTQIEDKQDLLNSYKGWWEQAKKDLKSTEDKYNDLVITCTKLKTSLDERQEHFDEKFKLLQENATLTKEYEHISREIDEWFKT